MVRASQSSYACGDPLGTPGSEPRLNFHPESLGAPAWGHSRPTLCYLHEYDSWKDSTPHVDFL